jgi:hypothetical protein
VGGTGHGDSPAKRAKLIAGATISNINEVWNGFRRNAVDRAREGDSPAKRAKLMAGATISNINEVWNGFRRNAVDRARIQSVVRDGGKCTCKRVCTRQFSVRHLMSILKLFWSLPKVQQDAYLWALRAGTADIRALRETHRPFSLEENDWKGDTSLGIRPLNDRFGVVPHTSTRPPCICVCILGFLCRSLQQRRARRTVPTDPRNCKRMDRPSGQP